MIDRASILTNKILSIVCNRGLGEIARREIRDALADAFAAVETDAIQEFHFRPPDEGG